MGDDEGSRNIKVTVKTATKRETVEVPENATIKDVRKFFIDCTSLFPCDELHLKTWNTELLFSVAKSEGTNCFNEKEARTH